MEGTNGEGHEETVSKKGGETREPRGNGQAEGFGQAQGRGEKNGVEAIRFSHPVDDEAGDLVAIAEDAARRRPQGRHRAHGQRQPAVRGEIQSGRTQG